MSSYNETIFSAALLKAGDNSQRSLWAKGKGSSIFVKWFPDGLDESAAIDYFSPLGTISKIEFTYLPSGRNMFVHFEEWKSNTAIQKIVDAYPRPHNMTLHVNSATEKYNGPAFCTLECYIDTRPSLFEKDAEIAVLKAVAANLHDDINTMITEVMHRDEMIDQLIKDNSNHLREIEILKQKSVKLVPRQKVSYIHFDDEDIAMDPPEEDSCCFAPCNALDLPIGKFIKMSEETSAEIERWNDAVLRHNLPDRHMKIPGWDCTSMPKQEAFYEEDQHGYYDDYDRVEDRYTNGWRIEQLAADE